MSRSDSWVRLRLSAKRVGLPARTRQRCRRVVLERDDQHLAVDLRAVPGRSLEVQDEARALAGLGDADRAKVALVDLDRRLAEPVGDAGQVERDARRRLDGESRRDRRQRFAHLDADHLGARLLRAVDRLDDVLRPRRKRRSGHQSESENSRAPARHRILPNAVHRAFS
jgi:hypothetical protein